MATATDEKALSLEDKLFTVRRKPIRQSHITLDEKLCGECQKRTCIYVCPAGVYEWNEAESKVHVSYEDCLECGTCRLACGMNSIEWTYPIWGEGISYKLS